jgi:hypothetical protein
MLEPTLELLRNHEIKLESVRMIIKKEAVVYWVPVIVMSQLNVVRLPVLAAAVNVSVAWIDCPVGRT